MPRQKGEICGWRLTIVPMNRPLTGYDALDVSECEPHHQARVAVLLAACDGKRYVTIEGVGEVNNTYAGDGPLIKLEEW